MKRQLAYGVLILAAPVLLSACLKGGMSKTRFQELPVERRLAYCQENTAPADLRECLALALEDQDDYPVTVSPEDLNKAFTLCEVEVGSDSRLDLSRCAATKLTHAKKKPGPGYRLEHLTDTISLCERYVPELEVDRCISYTLPYVYYEDTINRNILGSGSGGSG